MSKILVSGLINIESTLKIRGFPLDYNPVNYPFFGVQSRVSGVGYNLAKALTTLGNQVAFLSIIGQDQMGGLVRSALMAEHISDAGVLSLLRETCQSVILYEPGGRRQIHCDLKDVQETEYPLEAFDQAARDCEWALLCNVNFSRRLLARALQQGKHIATDVHAIGDLGAAYEQDFLRAAEVLFFSHENLPGTPQDFIQAIWQRFGTPVVVAGLGASGALLGIRNGAQLLHVPAVQTRPIVSTIGAGDALFSSFLHAYIHGTDPLLALRKAVVFSSFKIGVASAADGFLDSAELDALTREVYGNL